jgi:hypothetical protein
VTVVPGQTGSGIRSVVALDNYRIPSRVLWHRRQRDSRSYRWAQPNPKSLDRALVINPWTHRIELFKVNLSESDVADWERDRVDLYRRGFPDFPCRELDWGVGGSIFPLPTDQAIGYATAATPEGGWFVRDNGKVLEVELSRSAYGERVLDCRIGDVGHPIEFTLREAKPRKKLAGWIRDMAGRQGLSKPTFSAGHHPAMDSFGRVGAAPLPHPE